MVFFLCRSTGIRDDLVFLIDEELTNIQLCALHMEMRNTEQLLASIGFLAYKVDSLPDANAALKNYGPESFHGDRISVKKKSDQQSAISKQNVHVSSMSGNFFSYNYYCTFSLGVVVCISKINVMLFCFRSN